MAIRIGIVGLDTVHAQVFPTLLLGQAKGKRTYPDMRVTHYYTRGDQPAREKYLDGIGAKRVDHPEIMIGQIDAVMIEWVRGEEHLAAAKPFAAAKVPMFIDKPYTASWEDAKALAALVEEHRCPVQSGSSLRFAPESDKLRAGMKDQGRLITASFTGPNGAGLYDYGVHTLELMMGVLGARYRPLGVSWVFNGGKGNDDVVQLGLESGETVNLIMLASAPTKFTAELRYQKGVLAAAYTDSTGWYAALMKEVAQFFRTKKPTLPLTATMEVMRIIEAANRSKKTGQRVDLASVL